MRSTQPGRVRLVLVSLGALACLGVLLGLKLGSVPVGWQELLALAIDRLPVDAPARDIIGLRAPRVLAAFATGGLLAVAGALMQVLLSNPLGDPYVLGVSGGAAVGALLAMSLGTPALAVDVAALVGALAALVLVLLPGRRLWRSGAASSVTHRLLLTGVVLSAGWSAIITLILTLAPDMQLRGMMVWLMGDLGGAMRWQLPAGGLLLLVLALQPLAADLNVMLRGDVQAFALGVPIERRRFQIYLLASLATALAVTTGGTIGFVGLLVPHALRLCFGNDQRLLLPAAALSGGLLLTASDTAARTLFAPSQLPVGVLTALLGVPAFLWLLARSGPRS